jgi:hypothetical protein
MRLVAVFLLALALCAPAAHAGMLTSTRVEDLGLPFWCDWGYDWDERCYTDNTARLPVGGVDDKVWRAALRFTLDDLLVGASITSARLELYFDGTCVAPRRRAGACVAREYAVDTHAILSTSWTKEREVSFDPGIAAEFVVDTAVMGWTFWDMTDVVRAWAEGTRPNRGLLLKLADEEGYGVSGPYFPSAMFRAPSVRPRLVVAYGVPTSGLFP